MKKEILSKKNAQREIAEHLQYLESYISENYRWYGRELDEIYVYDADNRSYYQPAIDDEEFITDYFDKFFRLDESGFYSEDRSAKDTFREIENMIKEAREEYDALIEKYYKLGREIKAAC